MRSFLWLPKTDSQSLQSAHTYRIPTLISLPPHISINFLLRLHFLVRGGRGALAATWFYITAFFTHNSVCICVLCGQHTQQRSPQVYIYKVSVPRARDTRAATITRPGIRAIRQHIVARAHRPLYTYLLSSGHICTRMRERSHRSRSGHSSLCAPHRSGRQPTQVSVLRALNVFQLTRSQTP